MEKLPRIRWATESDFPRIREIAEKSFDDPRTIEQYHELRKQPRVVGQVVEIAGAVVAAMFYTCEKDYFEIIELVVDPAHRLAGVGSMLIDFLTNKVHSGLGRRTSIALDVSDRNLASHLFLKKLGFRARAVTRNQFGRADGYRFEYTPTGKVPA